VKLFVVPAARTDIRGQYEYYLELDLTEVGDRFVAAVDVAIEAALTTPKVGAPKHVRNPQLTGLRSWSVQGFDEFHVYYLIRDDVFIVVRVLHDKRDVLSILGKQSIDDPDLD
jgi:plasmid stabilization system protein ParE